MGVAGNQHTGDLQKVAHHFHGLGISVAHGLVIVPRYQTAIRLVGKSLVRRVVRGVIVSALGCQQIVDLLHLIIQVGSLIDLIRNGLGTFHLALPHLAFLATVLQTEREHHIACGNRSIRGSLPNNTVTHIGEPESIRPVIPQGRDRRTDIRINGPVQNLGSRVGIERIILDGTHHGQAIQFVHPDLHLTITVLFRCGEDLAERNL